MRQVRPLESGYPIDVPGVGAVGPGDEFDAPGLVAGCVPVEPGTGTATADGTGPAAPGAGVPPAGAADSLPGPQGTAPDDTSPGPGRKARTSKETGG